MDHRDGAPATIGHIVQARAAPQPAAHRAQEHRDDGATEVVIPGEPIPQAVGQAQHPLPHSHIGKDVIDQVRGALGHPPPTAARTERPAFARKRDQAIEAARRAAKPREATGQPAAAEIVPKLVFDEPRQALPVAEAGGLRAEGLDVFVHNPVEHALGGMPRLVARGRQGHGPRRGRWRANRGQDGIGPSRRAVLATVAGSAYAAHALSADLDVHAGTRRFTREERRWLNEPATSSGL